MVTRYVYRRSNTCISCAARGSRIVIGGSENFAMKWTILVESSKRGRATRIFVGTFHVSCHLNIYLSFPFREIFLLILLSKSFFARSCEKLASANFSTILSPQLSFEFLPAKTKHRRIVSRLITWKLCHTCHVSYNR